MKSLVLSQYIANPQNFPQDYWKGKRVLELGAGTGIVGIVAGLLGKYVLPFIILTYLRSRNHSYR